MAPNLTCSGWVRQKWTCNAPKQGRKQQKSDEFCVFIFTDLSLELFLTTSKNLTDNMRNTTVTVFEGIELVVTRRVGIGHVGVDYFWSYKVINIEKDYFHYLILTSLSASYIAEIGQFQNDLYDLSPLNCRVGCVFPMIVVSLLLNAEFG